jgi:hypothetical protein
VLMFLVLARHDVPDGTTTVQQTYGDKGLRLRDRQLVFIPLRQKHAHTVFSHPKWNKKRTAWYEGGPHVDQAARCG